jgi:hypothetical protein
MSDEMMSYTKSPIPAAKPGGPAAERNPDRAIDTDAQGNLQYRTGAASGHVEIELPSLPGSSNPTERLHARDFGEQVIAKIESSLKRQPYMKSGAQQSPAQVFAHYVAVARGSGLMDEGALKRAESLAQDFEREPDQAEFYSMVVKNWLGSLSPKRRQP